MQNSVFFTGRVGKDPEVRYTPQGQAVMELSVAATDKYTARDGSKKEETCWINAVCFGGWAENLVGTTKGDLMQIEGALRQDTWDDKTTGAKRSKTFIKVNRIWNHSRKTGSSNPDDGTAPSRQGVAKAPEPVAATKSPIEDDDVPF